MTIQAAQSAAIQDRGYKVLAQGLMINRDLSWDEWLRCGRALTEIANRTTWAIGDWIVYGAGRGDYGEYYVDAKRITGRSFESLSQYARVSKEFPIEGRVVAVPWSFYREALRLPDKDRTRALEVSAVNHWTRDDLATYINGRDNAVPVDTPLIGTPDDARSATAKRVAPGGWQRKKHRKILQCPSCGWKFEARRRDCIRIELAESADAVDPIGERVTD